MARGRTSPADGPGGPPSRTPVPVRTRRSFGDVLRAVGAVAALAVLLLGVPVALAYVIGWPLPQTMPTLEMLRDEISIGVFVDVLAVVVWLAWAQFTACVLVEMRAAVSGVGLPARVPGAGGSQWLARQLVAAVLLLGSTAASFAPGLAHLGQDYQHQNQPQAAASAQQTSGQQSSSDRRAAPQGAPHHEVQQHAATHGARADGTAAQLQADETAQSKPEKATKYYRIQPPHGRHHDSLWEIAERHLDDGRRYKEILRLNKDRAQPDGSKLTEASLIRPGWIMEMPDDAHGGELVELPDEAPDTGKELREQIQDYRGTSAGHRQDDRVRSDHDRVRTEHDPVRTERDRVQTEHDRVQTDQRPREQGGERESKQPGPGISVPEVSGDRAGGGGAGHRQSRAEAAGSPGVLGVDREGGIGGEDGGRAQRQDSETGARAEPVESAKPVESVQSAESADSDAIGLPEALIGAPLLAAGILAALGRRRRTALWQSAAGTTRGIRGGSIEGDFPPPTERAATAHDALLVGADPEGVSFLDRVLRGLSEDLAAQGRTLPAAHAVWLTGEELHLQLVENAGEPPAPWAVGQSPTFWTIRRSQARAEPESATAAPYPGLVSLGTRGDARLLLNIESVPGLVSVAGPRERCSAVLASVAAELATNGWSDRMTVTLVGFGAELVALSPTRVRHVEDVAGMIEVMEAETQQRRNALRSAGQRDVLSGRTSSYGNHHWAPHIVLIGTAPTDAEAERIAALAVGAHRSGIGYMATADEQLPSAVWEFEVTANGDLKAPLMGLELKAQLLPADECASVVELFAVAVPDSSEGEPRPGFQVDLSDQGRPAVYARLMGSYEIIGLDPPDEDRSELLHEALALLLLHREGVHPRVLASALWPKGVTADVRDAVMGRLRDWLGEEPDGSPRLSADEQGRLKLSVSVVSDIDVLRTLHHMATGQRGSDLSAAERCRRLSDALALARGPVLAQRSVGRYEWLTHELVPVQQPLIVAETGLALAAEYLELGKADSALHAVRSALRVAPADERLWEELVRTAHATGDESQLKESVGWVTQQSHGLHGKERGLPPRTQALIDELVPARRAPGAASG